MHGADTARSSYPGFRQHRKPLVKPFCPVDKRLRKMCQQFSLFFFCEYGCSFNPDPFRNNNIHSGTCPCRRYQFSFSYFSNACHRNDRLVHRSGYFRMSAHYLYVRFFTGVFHLPHHKRQLFLADRFRQQNCKHNTYWFRSGAGQVIYRNLY